MILLSIDVGIKNLAFCLLENNNKIKILDWQVVNISEEKKESILCEQNRKNKQCDKNYIYNFNNRKYCGLCCKSEENFKKYNYFDLNVLENSKTKKDKIEQYCKDFSISYEKKDTKEQLKKLLVDFVKLNCFCKPIKTKMSEVSLIDIGRNLNKILNDLLETWNVNIDLVLIENQISPIANRMKTLQGMITQYFIMKTNADIKYVSSENKLKEFSEKKTNYKDRKKLSIDVMYKLLKESDSLESWIKVFEASKKKDDLSDTYLQAFWYIKHL